MSVAIHITPLKQYWPNEKILLSEKVNAASLEYFMGLYIPKVVGFPIRQRTMSEAKTEQEPFIYIPPKYRHALRFLNFKNACYISALSVDRSEVDLETEDGQKWATIRDGMAQNVIFNDAVRTTFFDDVRNGILSKVALPLDTPGFRSRLHYKLCDRGKKCFEALLHF